MMLFGTPRRNWEDVANMLEKPDLPDRVLVSCLEQHYGMSISTIVFLPLGADTNTAVYRADATDGTSHFVKLRSGEFESATVAVPRLLRDRFGIDTVMAPAPALTGALWAKLKSYSLIVYPFVEGENGFNRPMSNQNWIDLGQTLKRLHSASLPDEVQKWLPRESFSPQWRERVVMFQNLAEAKTFTNAEADQAAAILAANRDEISDLVAKTHRLAEALAGRTHQLVPCHADIHAGNVLIDNAGKLYVVDWDTLCLAPKERDLMFIGAGIGGVWNTAEELAQFQQGYGPASVDADAIAYYRFERILVDIAEYCNQLLLTNEGGEDREQSLRYFSSNFGPNGLIQFTLSACQK